MEKFTKGEWHAEIFSSGKQAYVWADDGSGILANQSIGGTDEQIARDHANAHLIAAAPDGFKLGLLVMELCGQPHGVSEQQSDLLYEEALTFIKKARGEL